MLTSVFKNNISRTVARRFQSTAAPEISTTFLTLGKSRTFTKNWLSDPSCYPVMATLGFACFMALGVGATCLMNSPDVRISAEKKNAIVRNWGLP